MKCENCFKKTATQADLHLNEWLCDDCYSKLDAPNKSDEQLEAIEQAQILKRRRK